jgi:hypothetical protein
VRSARNYGLDRILELLIEQHCFLDCFLIGEEEIFFFFGGRECWRRSRREKVGINEWNRDLLLEYKVKIIE